MSPVYWTHNPEDPDESRPIGFALAFQDAVTCAVIAGVWLYLFAGWLG